MFPLHFSLIWPFKEPKSSIKVWSTLLNPQQHTVRAPHSSDLEPCIQLHYNPLLGYWSYLNCKILVELLSYEELVWSWHFSPCLHGFPPVILTSSPNWWIWKGGKQRRKSRRQAWVREGDEQEHKGQKVKRRVRVKLSRWNHKIPRLSLWSLQLKRSVWSYSLSQWPSVSVGAHIQKPLLVF